MLTLGPPSLGISVVIRKIMMIGLSLVVSDELLETTKFLISSIRTNFCSILLFNKKMLKDYGCMGVYMYYLIQVLGFLEGPPPP